MIDVKCKVEVEEFGRCEVAIISDDNLEGVGLTIERDGDGEICLLVLFKSEAQDLAEALLIVANQVED